MYVWYCPSPAYWIRAEIINDVFGHVTARTWDGQYISGLIKTPHRGCGDIRKERMKKMDIKDTLEKEVAKIAVGLVRQKPKEEREPSKIALTVVGVAAFVMTRHTRRNCVRY